MSDPLKIESSCNTFLPPRVHQITLRQHLYTLLDAAQKKLLIIVQGQAAQGKSTLVASYLNRSSCERNSVWLHLGKSDSHHTNLFNLLARAICQRLSLTRASGEVGRLNILAPTLGTGEELSSQTDTVIASLMALPSPATVVFDNYETLDDHGSSHDLLQKIIDQLMQHNSSVQFIIISRELPPLKISKLEMGQGSMLLKNEDLAFTLEETRNFFRQRNLFQLSSMRVEKIYTATHGWPGGVALIAEYLERGGEISSLPHHLTAETMDYFTHEVYTRLPHPIQQFLIRASLFDEINAEIAQRLCIANNLHGKSHADEILQYLERHNLFIQQLTGEDQKIYYRFNTLFKNYLLKLLTESLPPDEFRLLNIDAAQLFEKRGAKELSVHYYLEGEAYERAADMIKKCAVDLIVRGRTQNLQQWIEALPESIVQQDPWLICYLAITWRVKGGTRNVQNLLRALALFQSQSSIRGSMLAIAYLIEAGVFVRKSSEKIAEWIGQGEELLSQLGYSPLFSWTRAVLWQQIAFGYIAGEVDLQKGLSACQNARLLAKKIDNREIEINASIIMAFGYVRAGNCSEAGRELKTLNGLADEEIHPEYRALNHLINIDIELKKGNFRAAQKYLLESEADVERFGLIFLYPNFIELKAMHSIYTSKFETARHLADHLADFSIMSGNSFYIAIAHHIKALVHYHTVSVNDEEHSDDHEKRATLESAQKASREALTTLYEKKGASCHLYMAKLLHGLILIQLKEFKLAQMELSEAIDYFTKRSSYMALCETRSALGLLCWEQNRHEEALEHIMLALTSAIHAGYERFLLMSPSDFVKVVILGICSDRSARLLNDISPLLATHFSNHAYKQLIQLRSHPFILKKSHWNSTIRSLYIRLLPRIEITTLGRFSVMIGTRRVAERDWEGNRPKLLLKAIICHNSREICREKLIETLWPECSADVGEKNFKVNLHRLRNALEPDVDRKIGHCYITLNGGRISLDPQLVTVDIDTFTTLLEHGYRHLKQNEPESALSLFERAVMVYGGDFLPEESSLSWITARREALRRDFTDLAITLARIYEEQKQPLKAARYLRMVNQLSEE